MQHGMLYIPCLCLWNPEMQFTILYSFCSLLCQYDTIFRFQPNPNGYTPVQMFRRPPNNSALQSGGIYKQIGKTTVCGGFQPDLPV